MARPGAKHHSYTPEEIEWLRVNYRVYERPGLLKLFNSTFQANLTSDSLKSFLSSHKIFSGRTGRFVKGQTSFNKGLTWDDFMTPEGRIGSTKTTFKKGQIPKNTLPIGTVMMKRDGYLWIKLEDTKPSRFGWKQKHRYIYEQAHGPIPKGYNIVFLDGNRLNFDIDNLKMVSKRQHGTMCRLGLYKKDPELTNTGLLVVEVIQKAYEKRGNNEKQACRS